MLHQGGKFTEDDDNATVRQKLQIKPAFPPSYAVLMPSQPALPPPHNARFLEGWGGGGGGALGTNDLVSGKLDPKGFSGERRSSIPGPPLSRGNPYH